MTTMNTPGRAGRTLGGVVALLCLWAAPSAWAQAPGVLSGRVTDESGGVITGARIELSGPSTKQATSDGSGAYRVAGLAPGTYTMVITKARFAPFARADVQVAPGAVVTLDASLSVAAIEENMTVESESPLGLNPQDSASAIVLRGEDLEALPDDPDELAEALQALAGPAAGPSGGQIFIDGFSSGRLPPKASIREIRLNTNPFSAEHDRLGFGRIEVFTKPGTDRLRGSTELEFMDGALNSRNPYAAADAPYQRREWGGSLGGPLSKKASFFVDFERRDIDDNELVNATVLGPGFEPEVVNLSVLTPQHRTTVSPRIDYQLSPRHTLVARYSFTEQARENAGVGEFSLESRAFDTQNRQHSFQLTETGMLSDSVVNETRFQYLGERRRQDGDGQIPTIQVLEAFTGGGSQVGRSHTHEDRLELQNVTSWTRGKHSFRAGLRVRGARIDDVSRNNFGGTVTFGSGIGVDSLERYRRTLLYQEMGKTPAEIRALGGGATQLRVNGGDPEATVTQWDVGPFLQDDWRMTPNFTLSLGLRYENQTNISSHWNVAPRVAFAWTPRKGQERPKTVVRGGFGVFYDRVGEDLTLQADRFDGVSQQQYLVTDPAILDRIRFTPDGSAILPTADQLGAFALPQTTRQLSGSLEAPRTLQSSFSVERMLPRNVTFSAVLVSTRIHNVLRSRAVNAPRPGTGERPLGTAATVYQYESTGRFAQEQLILGFNSRFSRTVNLFTRYFLGRARSDSEGAGSFPASSYDLDAEYGPSFQDVRHRFVLGGSVRLPWGLRVSPFVIASSGRPFNITTGRDNNGDTVFTDRPAYVTDPGKAGVVNTQWGLLDPNPTPGQEIIPRNLGRGPAFFVTNLRLGKTIPFGKRKDRTEATDGGGPSGPPVMVGGGGMGRREGGGGGGGFRGGGGGGGGFGGGGDEANGRVNLTLSLNIQNVLNHVNAGSPVGNLGSPNFGRSLSTAGGFGFGPGGGGGGGTGAGNRRIELEARLGF
jgi:hypothetical protein